MFSIDETSFKAITSKESLSEVAEDGKEEEDIDMNVLFDQETIDNTKLNKFIGLESTFLHSEDQFMLNEKDNHFADLSLKYTSVSSEDYASTEASLSSV
jgi:hypothetical protein